MFLLVVALVVVVVLYLDLRSQYSALKAENTRLAENQVLLMVPEGQAEALANWLESHPEQTGQLIERATKPNSSTSAASESAVSEQIPAEAGTKTMQSDPPQAGRTDAKPLPEPAAENPAPADPAAAQTLPDALQPVVVSESGNGVKVIALPHGGIRVTTRDESKPTAAEKK
ncbi:hypothetical protein KJI95_00595 [Shewanella sp. JM162201]|uniref:Membrane anchored protein in chemotaxis locus n=1 Tax=Shewanella jiangmenensis TaxID=2837387 RepID=A0ABS5V080_9GAMM|nr:hypothetical protein [Shewanella jiangmenensis]MBT1443026.1 hypothetical protein [Shewanella jiangmenensis]